MEENSAHFPLDLLKLFTNAFAPVYFLRAHWEIKMLH